VNNDNNLKDDVVEAEGRSTKKLVYVLGAAVIICAVVLTIVFGGVIYKSVSSEANLTQTLAYELTSEQFTANVTTGEQEESWNIDLGNENAVDTPVANDGGNNVSQGGAVANTQGDNKKTTADKTTKNQAIENYEKLSPNGQNLLSDHIDNKYIKQISTSYGVDSDLLVAIYSEPDTGNNFVLEFNGKKDSDGNVEKSPDTLTKVYQIDKNGGVKIATGQQTGNVGVSYAEGLFCISMIRTVVMEQYPDYFTGLKQ
jgi:hypothetical protein